MPPTRPRHADAGASGSASSRGLIQRGRPKSKQPCPEPGAQRARLCVSRAGRKRVSPGVTWGPPSHLRGGKKVTVSDAKGG